MGSRHRDRGSRLSLLEKSIKLLPLMEHPGLNMEHLATALIDCAPYAKEQPQPRLMSQQPCKWFPGGLEVNDDGNAISDANGKFIKVKEKALVKRCGRRWLNTPMTRDGKEEIIRS